MSTSVRIKRFPPDYEERVYAGLLGLTLGIHAGRRQGGAERLPPSRELGRIGYDLNWRGDGLDCNADDRLSSALLAARIMEDFGCASALGPEHAALTFSNYAIEGRSGLWWGGLGHSAPHSAWLRLKRGSSPAEAGSSLLNGKIVAEQTGAEMLGPCFGLALPGDPARAAELAGKCASLCYSGEALCAAQASAAFVSAAFIARDTTALFEAALRVLPLKCAMAAMLASVQAWSSTSSTWQPTRELIRENYFGSFPDGHAVPHFAGVALALAHGGNSLRGALEIAALSGWGDASSLGVIAAVLCTLHGLLELESVPYWAGALNDSLLLPGADAGRCSSDVASEAQLLVRVARGTQKVASTKPKNGARFHFELPRSTHGFAAELSADSPGLAVVQNVEGGSFSGKRALAIQYHSLSPEQNARIAVPVFAQEPSAKTAAAGHPQFPETCGLRGSPALYPGQLLRAFVSADEHNAGEVGVRPFVRFLGQDDLPFLLRGPEKLLLPEARHEFRWVLPAGLDNAGPSDTIRLGRSEMPIARVPSLLGSPIIQAGLEIFQAPGATGVSGALEGLLHLDYFTWDGSPSADLGPPKHRGLAWRSAWVNAATRCEFGHGPHACTLSQDEGTGLLIQGAREWTNYGARVSLTPLLARAAGIAVRVQGLQRYYALLLFPGNKLRLVRHFHGPVVLAEAAFDWEFGQTVELQLQADGDQLHAFANGALIFSAHDPKPGLESGACALVIDEGCMECGTVRVE